MRVLMYCAAHPKELVRSADMAHACNASTHHVAQVVNQLSALGFLKTLRGRSGGVKLARDPAHLTVGEVFLQFEADLPLTECFDEQGNTCPLRACCRLREAVSNAVAAFYASLECVTLQELVCDNFELQALFATPRCVAGERRITRQAVMEAQI